MSTHFRRLVPVVCLAAILSGCAANGLFLHKSKYRTADSEHPVTRILCIWQPGEGKGLDGRTTRGFAGQIYFFTHGSDVPVLVDGDVRIYLFDDQGTIEEQKRPLHQFDFIGQGWDVMQIDTQLGPAYQVFIPYTRKGFHQTKCALRVRLTPTDGPVIHSNMVYVTLRGTKKKADDEAPAADVSSTGQDDLKAFTQAKLEELAKKYAPQTARSVDNSHDASAVPPEGRIQRDSTVKPASAMFPSQATSEPPAPPRNPQLPAQIRGDNAQPIPNSHNALTTGHPAFEGLLDRKRGSRDTSETPHPARQSTSGERALESERFRLTPVESASGTSGEMPLSANAVHDAPSRHPLAAHPLTESTVQRLGPDNSAAQSAQARPHPLRDRASTAKGQDFSDPLAAHVGGTQRRHPLAEAEGTLPRTPSEIRKAAGEVSRHPLEAADAERRSDDFSAAGSRPSRMRTHSIPLPR